MKVWQCRDSGDASLQMGQVLWDDFAGTFEFDDNDFARRGFLACGGFSPDDEVATCDDGGGFPPAAAC